MTNIILDASALLALIQNENGSEIVEQHLPNAVMSTVNISEVATLLVKLGLPADEIGTMISSLVRRIVPFDLGQAYIAADLIQETKTLGLSFADRACLSLAKQLELPVITADKAWGRLAIDIEIRLLR